MVVLDFQWQLHVPIEPFTRDFEMQSQRKSYVGLSGEGMMLIQ